MLITLCVCVCVCVCVFVTVCTDFVYILFMCSSDVLLYKNLNFRFMA